MSETGNPRRQIFENVPGSHLFVENLTKIHDSNVLVTISSAEGEHTVLMTPKKIIESKAKVFVQAPPERVVTGTSKNRKRLGSAFVGIGYVVAVVLLTFSGLSATGFIKARIVMSGSMAPTIKQGDIVVTASPLRVPPKIGSVAAYQSRRFDGAPVGIFTHRIIGGDLASGFIMKGDHNPNPDVQRPKINDVLGVVIFTVPFIGKFLTKKALFIIIPMFVGLWLVWDTLKESPNER